MKKIVSLLLVIILATSTLMGCGKSGDDSSEQGKTVAENAEANESEESDQAAVEEAEESEPQTITYMTWDYSDRTASTDAWIDYMKEEHNIIIDMIVVPTDQYEATLKTKIIANDLPDMVKVHKIISDYTLYGSSIEKDMFVDLSDLAVVDEYYESSIDGVRTSGGEVYYIPQSTNVLGTLYNKDVFKANGLEVPTNKDELIAVLDALKGAGVTPIAGGFKDAWINQIIPFIAFGQYINAKDMETRIKLSNGELTYSDIKDDFTKVLEVQQMFAEKGYFQNDYLGTDSNTAAAMVGTGDAAMLISGTWSLSAIMTANPDANIGFFALPLNDPGEPTTIPTNANEGICVAASGNVEASKLALEYFLSADSQVLVMNDLNGISTNKNVVVESAFVSDVSEAMQNNVVQPDWWKQQGYYQPARTTFALEPQLQALLAGAITVDEFIEEYDRLNKKAME